MADIVQLTGYMLSALVCTYISCCRVVYKDYRSHTLPARRDCSFVSTVRGPSNKGNHSIEVDFFSSAHSCL